MSKFFDNATSKVSASTSSQSMYIHRRDTFYVISLSSLIALYGGSTFPRLHTFDELLKRNLLKDYMKISSKDTIIYVSREVSYSCSPLNDEIDGTHIHHLIRILKRLPRIKKVSMDVFHQIVYKQSNDTSDAEWEQILNPKHTWIHFNKLCLPRYNNFESIPYFISRSSFLLVLTPTSSRRCYRTYRQQARCVYEMFCAFLMMKREPLLLVKSSTSVRKNEMKHHFFLRSHPFSIYIASLTTKSHSLSLNRRHQNGSHL